MVTYCSAADVAAFMQKASFSDSPATTPTKTQVESLILNNEDYIDSETGHAWRETTISNEYVDNPLPIIGMGMRFDLNHRNLKAISTGSGDKVEVFDGSNFIDYAATKIQGRAADFFVDTTNGVIFIMDKTSFYPKGFKVTYRYGDTTVNGQIKKACILLTAADILLMNDKSARFTDDGPSNRVSHLDRINNWKEQADNILNGLKEIHVI